MKIFNGIGKVSSTQKICLAGLFTALVAILQKILAVNYLAGLPFFRISFGGPALIIFSSIFLGPFWGAIVGFSSDLLGYFAFDASSIVYKPQIGIIYLILGFVSYYIFMLISRVKNDKKILLIEAIIFIVLFVAISFYVIFIYDCKLIEKILIPVGLGLLYCGLMIFAVKYKSTRVGTLTSIKISFASFVCDFLVLVLFGSVMKTWAFLIYYDDPFLLWITIIISQAIVSFFNVVFNTIVVSLFLKLTNKYINKDIEYARKQ